MHDRKAYLSALIGKPYRTNASGPDAFDCEGLARVVMRDLFGVTLPCVEDVLAQRARWTRLELPRDGAVMFIGVGDSDRHVGVYLRDGGVIHAVEGHGVLFDTLQTLKMRLRATPRFYVPA